MRRNSTLPGPVPVRSALSGALWAGIAVALLESVAGAMPGLTWNGFVLFLLPAAFVTETWIARAGAAARRA